MSANRYIYEKRDTDASFFARTRTTFAVLKRVFRYISPYKKMASAMIGCAILSLVAGLIFPKLVRIIIDDVIKGGRLELLTPVMFGTIGVFFLRDLFNTLRILVNNHFEQNVIFDMRCELFEKLQRLPVSYFDKHTSGDLMTRVIEDVNSVERVLIDGTEQGTVSILTVFGILGILLGSNPALTGVALIPMPLLIAGAWWYTSTAHKRYRKQRVASSEMNSLLMDNLQGVRQIKAFAREELEDEHFAEKAENLRQGTLTVMRAWAVYSPGMSFLASLGLAFILWLGGRMVIDGTMTEGQLGEFAVYLMMFYGPVNKLHSLNQMIAGTRASGERVFDILDTPVERDGAEDLDELPFPVKGEVRYEGVGFQYNDDREILKGIDLHAKAGEMIALVGPTGAGKSTLTSLLSGFYECSSGKVEIDGIDTSKVTLRSLRRNIAVVSQEPFLFNGSVRENLLFGKLDASIEEVEEACKAANCHEFIQKLKEGLDSKVGERGVKLSVGEKQRISIARALLADSPILVLDEATASVDTATERLIQQALDRLMKGRTSFVIAHRLSTIRNADQILVIRDGEIAERGTHDELMEKDGIYARLARIQNTTFIEESFEKIEADA